MSLIRKGDKAFEDLGISQTDMDNLRVNMKEMIAFLILWSSMLLGKMALDELDDESAEAKLLTSLINVTNRVNKDIYFYLNPGTFEQIINNPIPAMKTWTDFGNAANATAEYFWDPSGYQKDPVLWKWGKAFPLTNQLVKHRYISENLIR